MFLFQLQQIELNMTKEEMIAWIDSATPKQLLFKWRYAPIGSDWFVGEVGKHYSYVFNSMNKITLTSASKSIELERDENIYRLK
jgi:hypothetical protein